MMQLALSRDRRLSSVSLELVEEWLPEVVRRPICPILESFFDPSTRRDRALRMSGAPELADRSSILEAATREGLV
jgi:hypothetical protein